MEIGGNSGTIVDVATQSILGLSTVGLTLILTASAIRIRIRLPRPPLTGPIARLAPAVGFALALTGGVARAEKRLPIAPPVQAGGDSPPWSETSGFPPPRPLARTEATDRVGAHPALHGQRTDSDPTPLFPRARRSVGEHERAEAMRHHPAGKALGRRENHERETKATKYVVCAGDTLWSIAQHELKTEDLRAIARFWPKIHRANRDSIADPSLIRPGQILVIPDSKEG